MDDVKHIAYNLGKTGMSAKKIASVLETDVHTVMLWLGDAGIDPEDYKEVARRRQMAGIADAKAKGVRFGRPRVEPPENFAKIMVAMDHDLLTAKEAIQLSGMAEATFYRRRREYREKQTGKE